MKGDANLSSLKVTYTPPTVRPEFMGAHPPTKNSFGSAIHSDNVNYFQNYRNENLCKFQMPPYEWGLMSNQYSPRPDLVAANRVQLDQLSDPPRPAITLMDPVRQQDLDSFYKVAQMHRDQYKDHSGRLHPLNFFEKSEYKYQCPADMTSTYLRFPQSYVKYKDPLVLPRTLERTMRLPPLPHRSLGGRNCTEPDNFYNR